MPGHKINLVLTHIHQQQEKLLLLEICEVKNALDSTPDTIFCRFKIMMLEFKVNHADEKSKWASLPLADEDSGSAASVQQGVLAHRA